MSFYNRKNQMNSLWCINISHTRKNKRKTHGNSMDVILFSRTGRYNSSSFSHSFVFTCIIQTKQTNDVIHSDINSYHWFLCNRHLFINLFFLFTFFLVFDWNRKVDVVCQVAREFLNFFKARKCLYS